MKKQGKTVTEIAIAFKISPSYISKMLNGKYVPDFVDKPKEMKPKSIKQKLKEERTKEEAERIEREKGWCRIMCCNDRKSCMEIKHPENCLVWRLYNDERKKETFAKRLQEKEEQKLTSHNRT